MASFEFVITNGSPKRATPAIRSHAVRCGLSQKSRSSAAMSKENSRLTMHQKSSLRGRFRAKACGRDGQTATVEDESTASDSPAASTDTDSNESEGHPSIGWLSRIQLPVRSPRNLSNTMPMAQSRGVDLTISFFLSYMNIHITSMDISKRYFGFALTDPIVIHTIFGVASMMWAIVVPDPKRIQNEGYKQKALAISGIQARLEEKDTSNVVVGAISNLSQMEAIELNFETARLHLRAIDRIAQMRGGYSDLAKDVEVATAINWSDLFLANMTGKKPTVPLLTLTGSFPFPAQVLEDAGQPSVSHLRFFEETRDDTLIRFTFTCVRQAFYSSRSKDIGARDMRVICNSADHQLATLVQDIDRTSPALPLLITAQIFMSIFVRSGEVNCVLPKAISERLRQCFQLRMERMLRISEHWYGLTWCMWIGLVASPRGSDLWVYFHENMLFLTRKIQFPDAAHFKTVMQRFLWDDYRCDAALKAYESTFFGQENQEKRRSSCEASDGSANFDDSGVHDCLSMVDENL